jgi:hypothetical protein
MGEIVGRIGKLSGETMWQIENCRTGDVIRAKTKRDAISKLKEAHMDIDEWGFASWNKSAIGYSIGRKLVVKGDIVRTVKVYRLSIYRNGHVRWSL